MAEHRPSITFLRQHKTYHAAKRHITTAQRPSITFLRQHKTYHAAKRHITTA
ncbi:MAG: hypothetical protein IJP98_04420 [Clostridia bacterium]|nr:hypothetical protein [Clostridia bacterium]